MIDLHPLDLWFCNKEPPRRLTPLLISTGIKIVFSEAARANWPLGLRRFHPYALLQASDTCFSPLSMDTVTIFSLRCAEHYFIRHQTVYLECFSRTPCPVRGQHGTTQTFDRAMEYCGKHMNQNFYKGAWIDAAFFRVYVPPTALPKLLSYIQPLDDMPQPKTHIILCTSFWMSITAGTRAQEFKQRSLNDPWLERKRLFVDVEWTKDQGFSFISC